MKEVAQQYPGKVRFVSENWGDSKLAERYAINRYPVIFVDEVLVARPDDFGWDNRPGRYKPWRDPANHEKFKSDLTRMIELAFRDREALKRNFQVRPDLGGEIAALPDFNLRDLQGAPVTTADLSGQIVVVEFWATWCPPCLKTMSWLTEIKRRYGDRLTVLGVALESEEAEVRQLAEQRKWPLKIALGTEQTASAFGGITSVPTMYVFDQQGKTAAIFYGATEDLHEKVEQTLRTLLK